MILVSDTIAQYLDLTDDLNQRIAMILCGPNTPDNPFAIKTFIQRYNGKVSSEDLEIAIHYNKNEIVAILTSTEIRVPITKSVYEIASNNPRLQALLDSKLRYQLRKIREIGFDVDPKLVGIELAEKLEILGASIRKAKKIIEN